MKFNSDLMELCLSHDSSPEEGIIEMLLQERVIEKAEGVIKEKLFSWGENNLGNDFPKKKVFEVKLFPRQANNMTRHFAEREG